MAVAGRGEGGDRGRRPSKEGKEGKVPVIRASKEGKLRACLLGEGDDESPLLLYIDLFRAGWRAYG